MFVVRTYIKTYGCTLNRADSDIMAGLLEGGGVEVVGSERDAEVIVLNTCTVKRPTEQRILDNIKRLVKGDARLVVAGCMAGANADVIRKHAPNAVIVTTGSIDRIVDAVADANNGAASDYSRHAGPDKPALLKANGSVIARVPVSEGCLSACSFCETRFARGRLNSFPEDVILRAVENAAKAGSKEIELTSQDMGAYGADRKTDIAGLMREISEIDGDFKVRIGMLNPDHLHKYIDELIAAFDSDRFYRFLHLPVQAGSDRVLMDMGRGCGSGTFMDHVKRLRRGVKGIAIETDIIVGYPTETEEDFDETLGLLKTARPDMINISRFGAREHTRASRLRQLGQLEIKRRSVAASRLARRIQKEKNVSYVGRTIPVLLTEPARGSLNGRTDSYRQVVVRDCDAGGLAAGGYADLNVYSASSNALYCRPE